MKEGFRKGLRDPALQSVMQLADAIRKAQQKNLGKYQAIRKANPDFELKLYKPFIPAHFNRDEAKLSEQILLRQMDKLMQEEGQLDIQLDRQTVSQLEQRKRREREAMNHMDHFTFLRRQWADQEQVSGSKAHVEKLIHNVGSIKGHIHTIIKKQNNSQSNSQLHDIILQSPEYLAVQRRLNELELVQNSDSTIDSSKTTALEQQVQTLKAQLQKVQRENEQLKSGGTGRDQDKRPWIYKYKVRGDNGGYVLTLHTQSRVSGLPQHSALGLDELKEHLKSGQPKVNRLQELGANELGKLGMQEILSPKFISRKRIEMGDRFRPMSP